MKSFKELMLEAISTNKKAEIGEVKFLETSLKDPHIKKLIKHISDFRIKNGDKDGTIKAVETYVIEQYASWVSQFKNKTLHETANKNALESIIFDLYQKLKIKDEEAPEFSQKTFKLLVKAVEVENPKLWPLVSIVTKKAVTPKHYFVPNSSLPKDYNSVNTAAATNDGRFIWNMDFMQNLLDFAHTKGLKPKGKKYESNGGDIPDEYSYIEFLIIHEYLHYVMADAYFHKKLGVDHDTINQVGDFRSNYELVKAGYEQLPIGLYSDHVNYDRQATYQEMVDAVLDAKKEDKEENKDSGEGEGGFKVGDKVVIPKTGEIAIIKKVSEPDENGKQQVEIEYTGEVHGK